MRSRRPIIVASTACGGVTCAPGGPLVRFPFYLANHQLSTCGRREFSLSCNNNNNYPQTLLTLPSSSGNFLVVYINYKYQNMMINDPDNCLPKRFLHGDINLKGSPFIHSSALQNYTFVGCSYQPEVWSQRPVSCLAGESRHKVIFLVPTAWFSPPIPISYPPGCYAISRALVPDYFDSEVNDLQLSWDMPYCRSCEANGGVCGLENDTISNSPVQCFRPPKSGFSALPTAAKYGIVLGVGIPGALCIFWLVLYVCGKRRARGDQIHRLTVTELLAVIPGPPVRTGLDDLTIESYPKTQLGESWELPKPNDNTCPICLCEYQPKEMLRTIPECDHYFHLNCIDEWLRLNVTCPLCRNVSKEG